VAGARQLVGRELWPGDVGTFGGRCKSADERRRWRGALGASCRALGNNLPVAKFGRG